MAESTAVATEKYISRRGTDGERNDRELQYVITGAVSDTDAAAALATAAPTTHRGQPLLDLRIEEIVGADGAYEGTAVYGTPPFADLTTDPTGISFAFDTTGGTEHITQSLETIATHKGEGVTIPSFHGSIGVGTDGSVAGVDRVKPAFNWTETKVYEASAITTSLIRTIFDLTGKVNSEACVSSKVGTLAAGEVLFLGASGAPTNADEFAITYHFSGSPNRTDVSLETAAAVITGVSIKGWEYIWTYRREQEDTTAKALVPWPDAYVVERIYEEADLNDLDVFTPVPPPPP